MEQIVIFRGNQSFLLNSIDPIISVETAEQKKELLGVNEVFLKLKTVSPIDLRIGDYTVIFGEKYTINRLPNPTKLGTRNFEYSIVLESAQYDLLRCILLNQDVSGFSTSPTFTLTGDLSVFCGVIQNNINRVFSGQWSFGTIPSTTDKTITFDRDNCLSALQTICKQFEVEFRITENGNNKTIHIGSIGIVIPTVFEHGQGRGLYTLSRETLNDKNIVNRLYLFGGSTNIPSNYRNYSQNLKIEGDYIEAADSITAFGLIEGIQEFEDVFPKRLGVVGSVGGQLIFSDSSMDFDLNNSLIEGVSAKMTFNSGGLAGYSFEIKEYNHGTKTFTLIAFTDERGLVLPSATNAAFQISAGDEYVLTDISLPSQYITNAENLLRSKGQDYLDQNKNPRIQYGLTFDEQYFKDLYENDTISNVFDTGDYVQVLDSDMNIDGATRITGLTRNILYPYRYALTIADSYEVTLIERIISEGKTTNTIIKLNKLYDATKAKIGWRNTQELLTMVFDTDGFFDMGNIKPLSVTTAMVEVGVKSQQFVLKIVIEPNYGGQKNVVHINSGILAHYAIEETIRTWQIAQDTITLPNDNAYYIYAKCNKSNYNDAFILLSESQIKVDDVAGYYVFLIGVLHSVNNNVRWISLTYGSTTINGRFIRTGRIQSALGETYFDLDSGEIQGKIKFLDENGNAIDVNTLNQNLDNFLNVTYPNDKNIVQVQIDGKVETWFYDYVPNTSNEPASLWTTNEERNKHVDDLFFNTATGIAYRYKLSGSVYSWEEVRDEGVTQALLNASKAQDTADHKRRVFTTTPYPPYDNGDLWSQGATGEIMICINTRLTGNYVSTDWDKASKYTDDSTVNNFVNNVFGNYATNTQSQIDGKIEAWFQDTDPNIWSVEDRAKHDKDMWYKLNDKKLYRYKASTNSWERIEDADALAAYELASKAQDTADGKRRIFVATPYPPYDVGDLWTDGSHLYRCVTQRLIGSYNPLDWNFATFYDNTVTTINGGIVTSGRIQLAGDDYNIKAGITGNGTSDDSVRLWAGTSYENRFIAPCRILQSGKAFFREAVILTNEYNQEQGGICGDAGSTTDGIRAFFGSTYSSRSIAPCRIYSDGSFVATRGNIGNFQIDSGNLKNTDGSATILSEATNNGNNTRVVIGRNYNTSIIGSPIFGKTSNIGASFKSEGNDTENNSNICAIFEASGAVLGNFAIYAKSGDSLHNRLLANGRAYLDINSSTSIDPSMYDVVRISSSSEVAINFMVSALFRTNIEIGKEITFINLNNGVDMLLPASIGSSGNRRFEGGSVVTYIYAGFVSTTNVWFIKSFYNNDF